MTALLQRLAIAAAALGGTSLLGALGYWWIGGGRWGLGECLYMAMISATTVGFGETLQGMDQVPSARAWTVVVILLGVATFGYAASMLTAFLVESNLTEAFRRKAMKKQIESLSDHVIVCGVGSTGRHVVRELIATRTPCVAIEKDPRRMDEMAVDVAPATLLHVVGDATDDGVLELAGVARARGIIAALPDDKDNLYVVFSAHASNPRIRIVSRGHDARAAEKLRRAGANAVVSPNTIGGLRLASEMVRPNVVEFLDQMLRDKDRELRIEEVEVRQGSPAAGRTYGESRVRDATDALVLAVRTGSERRFHYNPGPETVLAPGTTLVVLGAVESVEKLRRFLAPGAASPGGGAPRA